MAIKRPQQTDSKQIDEWVESRGVKPAGEEALPEEEIKRFTVLMPISQHRKLKAFCATRGILLKDFVLDAISEKLAKG